MLVIDTIALCSCPLMHPLSLSQLSLLHSSLFGLVILDILQHFHSTLFKQEALDLQAASIHEVNGYQLPINLYLSVGITQVSSLCSQLSVQN